MVTPSRLDIGRHLGAELSRNQDAKHRLCGLGHTRAGGNEFNDEARGAWYCARDALTSAADVGFHRTREFGYIGRYEGEARSVERLADCIGDCPDLGGANVHRSLDADAVIGYPAGQALAADLRCRGHRGLIYPIRSRASSRAKASRPMPARPMASQ
ncbi:MAG: RES family NAD+ phosphorylase [Hyphomicrobiales bacterium]|nr:RES family NAD+ phosphorylase [Hyphomicrobiales bacterium]